MSVIVFIAGVSLGIVRSTPCSVQLSALLGSGLGMGFAICYTQNGSFLGAQC